MICPILNSVSDDILKVILTNQNTLKARVRPALVTVWYEVEEGTIGCSFPHFYDGYGRDSVSQTGEGVGVGVCGVGQDLGHEMVFSKESDRGGPLLL